jgi:hypothetical protein
MDISNDPSVNEMDGCIIYKSTVNRAGVEDGEVSVFNTQGMEVRVGVSVSMQSHAIYRITLLVTSLDRHTVSD